MAKKPKETQANAKLFKNGALYKEISRELHEYRKSIDLSVQRLSLISGVNMSTVKYFEISKENGKGFSVGTLSGIIKAMQLDPMEVLPPHGGALDDFQPLLTKDKTEELMRTTERLQEFKPQMLDLIRLLSDVARTVKPNIDGAVAVFTAEESYKITSPNALESLITLGRRTRSLRILKGWSRSELATKSGVPLGSVFVIEAGMQNPSLQTMYQLAEALRVSPGFFIRYDDDAERLQVDLEQRAAAMIAADQISQVSDLLATLEYIYRTSGRIGRFENPPQG
ncbi:helix-turn-helix transcriptional regulator [Acetobacter sacchari]|uniref:Helix-turn-helix transcriptional regulator n=1 Tax=Acetobacter sacchari TaxID=2661687 RepID=A0ABS3LW93_9PROT|nr:helix-turn-helix transcriptional regulator [Acetobacter sacchari]MBO1360174.1 helix-turn-helix transcriptional regulator [Acetobacter sacchari]